MLSCEIYDVLQSIFLTEHYWTTASEFQLYFGSIACFVRNKSIQSQDCDCEKPSGCSKNI